MKMNLQNHLGNMHYALPAGLSKRLYAFNVNDIKERSLEILK